MKVLICGAGSAGLTLAFWLARSHYDVTVVEESPGLPQPRYMIEFGGAGYDVAEKMGLLPQLASMSYPISRLVLVTPGGQEKSMITGVQAASFASPNLNIVAGDLERVLYEKVKNDIQSGSAPLLRRSGSPGKDCHCKQCSRMAPSTNLIWWWAPTGSIPGYASSLSGPTTASCGKRVTIPQRLSWSSALVASVPKPCTL
jgi:hypothetical protein